jgi:hypothetical protein
VSVLCESAPRHLWVLLTLFGPLSTLRLKPETAAAGSGKAFRVLDAMGVLVLHGMKRAKS